MLLFSYLAKRFANTTGRSWRNQNHLIFWRFVQFLAQIRQQAKLAYLGNGDSSCCRIVPPSPKKHIVLTTITSKNLIRLFFVGNLLLQRSTWTLCVNWWGYKIHWIISRTYRGSCKTVHAHINQLKSSISSTKILTKWSPYSPDWLRVTFSLCEGT